MTGVVTSESYHLFNNPELAYGFGEDKREKIVMEYVQSTYPYKNKELFAAILNEYTDWKGPSYDRSGIRDKTLNIFSDATVVAPVVKTLEIHSRSNLRSYFYVFNYQVKEGDYPDVSRPSTFFHSFHSKK